MQLPQLVIKIRFVHLRIDSPTIGQHNVSLYGTRGIVLEASDTLNATIHLRTHAQYEGF
jgi:hypothetical protein